MPPKPRISKDDIIKAGFETVRKEGAEKLSVRTVGAYLGCSTQPIMYHFKTTDDLKAAVYNAANSFHTEYIMRIRDDEPLLSIGLNYIRFGAEESRLFRFLFQTDKFSGKDFSELVSDDELQGLFDIVSQESGLSPKQAKRLFETLFICAHGIASLLANNRMKYDELHIRQTLSDVYSGAFEIIKRGN